MDYGINGAGPLLEGVETRGFTLARIDLRQFATVEIAREHIQHAVNLGLRVLGIVENAAHLAEVGAPMTYAELRNEPDFLEKMDPWAYAVLVTPFVEAARECGAAPCIGAISGTAGLDWFRQVLDYTNPDPFVIRTWHRYPVGHSATAPQGGYATRDDEIDAWKALNGPGALWGVSEFGWHQAPQRRISWLPAYGWNAWRWTDEEVLNNAAHEWAYWLSHGAQFACFYQITDGPTDTREDRFGLRRVDGSWKPVAESLL